MSLGGGGGAPMDQQQGAWSGELTTVTDVFSGQGIGQRLPIGYVCHSISFGRNALSAATRGRFVFLVRKIAVVRATLGGQFSTINQP